MDGASSHISACSLPFVSGSILSLGMDLMMDGRNLAAKALSIAQTTPAMFLAVLVNFGMNG